MREVIRARLEVYDSSATPKPQQRKEKEPAGAPAFPARRVSEESLAAYGEGGSLFFPRFET